MSDSVKRRRSVSARTMIRRAGMAATVPVLTLTLCPVVEEQKHIDAETYPPINPVGQLSVNYVSSGVAYSNLYAWPREEK